MYPCFSHWSSIHPFVLTQNSQKHAHFLISITNISPMSLFHIESNALDPSIVLQYQGTCLFTSSSSMFLKNIHNDLICSLPSWPKCKFSPIDHLYWWFELIWIMAHLVPPKHSFHKSTYSIILTLSMSCFKKDPSMTHFFLLVKPSQPIKTVC